MKKISLILMAVAALSSCSKGDEASSSSVGYGSMSIEAEVESTTQIVVKSSDGTYEIPEGFIPSIEDFSLVVEGEYVDVDNANITHEYYGEFATIEEYNTSYRGTSPIHLWSGEYVATISNGCDTSIESATNACFGAEPTSFTVIGDDFTQSKNIEVKLINSIIRVTFDDWFKDYFSAASITITTESGSEFDFDPYEDGLDEKIYFVVPGTALTLKGTATKASSSTSTVTFTENSIGTALAGQMNTINVVVTGVGGLDITITVDDSIIDIVEDEYEFNSLEE